ncbi:CU044_2847 family protein [Streptomyces nojiriensis]|uniref:CU044_2847 family protein n=1 Tax=Streptomyces nojiriensis TaxID=66374 RepID=UPI0036DD80EB
MTETVAIDLGDGSTVTAEVIGELKFEASEDQRAPGYGDVGFGSGQRTAAQLGSAVALTLDQVRGTVQGIGRWAAESLTQGEAGSPDAFEVEFGLKLAVKSGQLLGIIAEAGSEAGLTVRLSWNLAERREREARAVATAPAATAPAATHPPAPAASE